MSPTLHRLLLAFGFVEEREAIKNPRTGKSYECLQCGLVGPYQYCSYCTRFCPCGAVITNIGGLCDFHGNDEHDALVALRRENQSGGIEARSWDGLTKPYLKHHKAARKRHKMLRSSAGRP